MPKVLSDSLEVSTMRASICTWGLAASRVSIRPSMTLMRSGTSEMIRVFVRSSVTSSPRGLICFFRMAWMSLTLAKLRVRVETSRLPSCSRASRNSWRRLASRARSSTLPMRRMFPSWIMSRPLTLSMISRAWSQGTCTSSQVNLPVTLGLMTMFSPETLAMNFRILLISAFLKEKS